MKVALFQLVAIVAVVVSTQPAVAAQPTVGEFCAPLSCDSKAVEAAFGQSSSVVVVGQSLSTHIDDTYVDNNAFSVPTKSCNSFFNILSAKAYLVGNTDVANNNLGPFIEEFRRRMSTNKDKNVLVLSPPTESNEVPSLPPCIESVDSISFAYSDSAGKAREAVFSLKALQAAPVVSDRRKQSSFSHKLFADGSNAVDGGLDPTLHPITFASYSNSNVNSPHSFVAPYSLAGISSFTIGSQTFPVSQRFELTPLVVTDDFVSCEGTREHFFAVYVMTPAGAAVMAVSVQETSVAC